MPEKAAERALYAPILPRPKIGTIRFFAQESLKGAFCYFVAKADPHISGAPMSTKKFTLSLGSILVLGLFASPCAAQVVYVMDPAGYVRPVVIPQATTFSMGFQATPVVTFSEGGGTFIRLNVTPFNVSMPDPTTTVFQLRPNPIVPIFSNGNIQPPLLSNKLLVVPVQLGQAGIAPLGSGFGQFQPNPFALIGTQTRPSTFASPAGKARIR
jgi:hypothetical protein